MLGLRRDDTARNCLLANCIPFADKIPYWFPFGSVTGLHLSAESFCSLCPSHRRPLNLWCVRLISTATVRVCFLASLKAIFDLDSAF